MLKKINKKDTTFLLNKYFKKEFNGIINSVFNKTIGYYEDTLLGFINYDLIYDRIEINYIYVFDDYRNKGIATKLINSLEKYNITLEVNESNIKAINLYNKLGFRVINIRENYYGNKSCLVMIKEVN